MEQIPDDFDSVALARLHEWSRRTEVQRASLIHHGPADRLAGRVQTDVAQSPIVSIRLHVVLRRRNLIDPLVLDVGRGRAFEAGDEETTKHAAPP
jgi:hypothetical protein